MLKVNISGMAAQIFPISELMLWNLFAFLLPDFLCLHLSILKTRTSTKLSEEEEPVEFYFCESCNYF